MLAGSRRSYTTYAHANSALRLLAWAACDASPYSSLGAMTAASLLTLTILLRLRLTRAPVYLLQHAWRALVALLPIRCATTGWDARSRLHDGGHLNAGTTLRWRFARTYRCFRSYRKHTNPFMRWRNLLCARRPYFNRLGPFSPATRPHLCFVCRICARAPFFAILLAACYKLLRDCRITFRRVLAPSVYLLRPRFLTLLATFLRTIQVLARLITFGGRTCNSAVAFFISIILLAYH